MRYLFTGMVMRNAMINAVAREPQKMRLVIPASMAPGMLTMMRLSTISMTVMDMVSAESATGIAAASVRPDLRTVLMVRA